jgi:Leucine rich repeat/Leucine Rich repeat
MTALASLYPHFPLLCLLLSFPFLSLCQLSPFPSPSPSPLPSPSIHLSPFNSRLADAFVAFEAWKHVITSDPQNITHTWCGPFVCNYTGVYCAPAPDDPYILTVAGVDINHGNITGTLPDHLSLLRDLTLLHLNSNQFHGEIPVSLSNLTLLFEIDLSNNHFSGQFPSGFLSLPKLKYLDIRFNNFSGEVPSQVFDTKIDAFFINNNKFSFSLPPNFVNSTASVLVLANNGLSGCLPKNLGAMKKTLNELLLLNSNISSCIPEDIGSLDQLTVLDLSYNNLVGTVPESVSKMKKLQVLDLRHNMLTGEIPEPVCELPSLKNLTYSDNYFLWEPEPCLKVKMLDDSENCIYWRPHQRPEEECIEFLHRPPAHCDANGCIAPAAPPPHW